MIVQSGTLRGRPLKALGRQPWLRPTSDKAREALMDVLRPVVGGARFVDLCCGTGAIGIEALSNGASHAVFVDNDTRSIRLVTSNLRSLGLGEPASVVKTDAVSFASSLTGAEFDILFADPPFGSGLQGPLLGALAEHLRGEADGCIIVMEHASREGLLDAYEGEAVDLRKYQERRYGDVSMAFFRAVKHDVPGVEGQG
ncbi:MAG TPA: 16S rRNA (guanine(966)-N(2))-methyltransferase RsmD [Candidatus Cryosericum sp.]